MALLRTITGYCDCVSVVNCTRRDRRFQEKRVYAPWLLGHPRRRPLACLQKLHCYDDRRRSNCSSNDSRPGRCSLTCTFLLTYPSRLYPIRVSVNGTFPPLDSTSLLIITSYLFCDSSIQIGIRLDSTFFFFFLSVLSCRPAHTARPVSILTPVPAPLWLRAHPDRLPLPARYLPSRLAYLPTHCLVLLPPP